MPAATQERTYHLGDVKPVTQRGADFLGNLFGIRTIGGYREHGSVPGSDHPKGLAADFMTSSKSVGDRLATFAVKHYKPLGIKYVIWWRRIWTPSQGWHDYHGPSDHTDHVHVSFLAKGGTGKLEGLADVAGAVGGAAAAAVPDGLIGAIRGVGDQIKGVGTSLAAVGKLAELVASLFLPNNIIRGVSGAAGTLFVLIGIYFLSREARSG
jgi:hypothetical protein